MTINDVAMALFEMDVDTGMSDPGDFDSMPKAYRSKIMAEAMGYMKLPKTERLEDFPEQVVKTLKKWGKI